MAAAARGKFRFCGLTKLFRPGTGAGRFSRIYTARRPARTICRWGGRPRTTRSQRPKEIMYITRDGPRTRCFLRLHLLQAKATRGPRADREVFVDAQLEPPVLWAAWSISVLVVLVGVDSDSCEDGWGWTVGRDVESSARVRAEELESCRQISADHDRPGCGFS